MKSPRVSIVTIGFNCIEELKSTVQSVVGQRDVDFEFIVIDGGSSDGTRDFLTSLTFPSFQWVSEPDKGVWDAMNKGVARSSGEYVIFMNAGDLFASSDSLSRLVKAASPEYVCVYGDAIFKLVSGELVKVVAKPLRDLWKGMCFSHQALISRRDALVENPFPVVDRVADYTFIVNQYLGGAGRFKYVNEPICIYALGGMSDRHYIKGMISRIPAASRLKSLWIVWPWYLMEVVKQVVIRFIRSRIPLSARGRVKAVFHKVAGRS